MMNMKFSKAQIARASKVGSEVVAAFTFGSNSRFCAELCQTRFGEPCVFILDADQPDENFPTLRRVVWQGSVGDIDKPGTGFDFVEQKYYVPQAWELWEGPDLVDPDYGDGEEHIEPPKTYSADYTNPDTGKTEKRRVTIPE